MRAPTTVRDRAFQPSRCGHLRRASAAALVLCSLVGRSAPVALALPPPAQRARTGTPSTLGISGVHVRPRMVERTLVDIGFGRSLGEGAIVVGKDGSIRTARGTTVGPLKAPADLRHLLKTLKREYPLVQATSMKKALALLEQNVTGGYENDFNDRTQGGKALTSDVEKRYRFGNAFQIPLVRVTASGGGEFVRTSHSFQGLGASESFFKQAAGGVLMPLHPQELSCREGTEPVEKGPRLEGRTASSERTARVCLGKAPTLIKLDLRDVSSTYFYRTLLVSDGLAAVKKTDFLATWLDRHRSSNPHFAFEPEMAAVLDRKQNVAAILRSARPYPPPSRGTKTWPVKFYSLIAKDPENPSRPPLLVRLIQERPDKKMAALDYAMEKVIRPLIEVSLAVHIDLGAAATLHQQNTALEIGQDGHPTGRIIVSDLSDLHLNPRTAAALSAGQFSEKYGFSDFAPKGSFQSFDHWVGAYNLRPLRQTLERYFPEAQKEIRTRIRTLVAEGLQQRRAAIEAQRAAGETGFSDLLARGANY
jgi:hypothetical protein